MVAKSMAARAMLLDQADPLGDLGRILCVLLGLRAELGLSRQGRGNRLAVGSLEHFGVLLDPRGHAARFVVGFAEIGWARDMVRIEHSFDPTSGCKTVEIGGAAWRRRYGLACVLSRRNFLKLNLDIRPRG